nr:hypothetical protein [Flavobacterium sp. ASV13]
MLELYLGRFQDYVNSLEISKNIQNEILSPKFISENPSFYLYYPDLFSAMFDITDQQKISQLSIAGYFYYQSTLIMDTIIDENNILKYPVALVCQEETIKILTTIYTINSKFWKIWNDRKNEFFNAAILQEKLIQKSNVDFTDYEILADYKSAFGKIAIDSVFSLTDKKDSETYNKILNSHKYFSIGFQLYDDVTDFKADHNKKQFNWAVYELSQALNFEAYNHDSATLNKLLYIRGVGQEILEKAIANFVKAEESIAGIEHNSKWIRVIQEMKNRVRIQLNATNQYLKSLN